MAQKDNNQAMKPSTEYRFLESLRGPLSVSASSCTSDDLRLVVNTQAGTPASPLNSISSVSTPEPPELDQGESLDTPPSPDENRCYDRNKDKKSDPSHSNTRNFQGSLHRLHDELEKTPNNKNSSNTLPTLFTPLKALSDAAKRLFDDDSEIIQNTNLVFISPSKRKPRRVNLTLNVAKQSKSPDKKDVFMSSWEERHNALDLDKHRTTKNPTDDSMYNDTEMENTNQESVDDSLSQPESWNNFDVYSQSSTDSFQSKNSESSRSSIGAMVANKSISFEESLRNDKQCTPKKLSLFSPIKGSSLNHKYRQVTHDDFIFKTPTKTPPKSANKRYRKISSSSSGSPSPRRSSYSNIAVSLAQEDSGSKSTQFVIAKGISESFASSNEAGFCNANDSSYECAKKMHVTDMISQHAVEPHSQQAASSRRSPRLKDGVVKSLFNKSSEDSEPNNTKNTNKLTETGENFQGNLTNKDEEQEARYKMMSETVLLDLDVNRELVPQLTPKKRNSSSEKTVYGSKNDERKIKRNQWNQKNTVEDINKVDNGKMSECLTKALGLVPNDPSFEGTGLPKTSSKDPNIVMDDNVASLSGTKRCTNFTNIQVDALSQYSNAQTSYGTTMHTKISSVSNAKENEKDNKIVKSNEEQIHIPNKSRADNIGAIATNDKRTTKKQDKKKKSKKKDRRGSRKIDKRKSLPHDNLDFGKLMETEGSDWPSPEDIKTAYKELKLLQPPSPNSTF